MGKDTLGWAGGLVWLEPCFHKWLRPWCREGAWALVSPGPSAWPGQGACSDDSFPPRARRAPPSPR